MSSLKSFLYEVAPVVGMTSSSLYERQRELVRHGLLPVREGRGPGSGVPLTPETVATFVIGLLASDSLTDLAEQTASLCSARPLLVTKRSTRRGATFHSDVAKALVDSAITGFQPGDDLHDNLYAGIQVTRHWRGVLLQNRELTLGKGEAIDGIQGVEYIVSEEARLASSLIAHTASIEMEPFWALCMRLRAKLGSQK
jgi:hypothetical protein